MAEELASQSAPAGRDQGPSDEEIRSLLDELKPSAQGNLIGVLQEVQERLGYLPAAALDGIARRMRIPLSRVYGVVSFYAQFYTEPRGRHTVRACRGTACHVKGSSRVIDAIQQALGIDEGQTTPDMLFYVETVACVGTCFLAPVMMIDDQYFGKLTPQRVRSILDSYQAKES